MMCDGYNKAWNDYNNAANGCEKAIPCSNKKCNGCNDNKAFEGHTNAIK